MKDWIRKKKWNPYWVAFGIPFLICICICLGNKIYPFGKECILEMDMYHQYCPFFAEFLNKLQNGGSLFYSWDLGLGSDFVSLYAYYLASPFNWLLLICPSGAVIEFMTVLVWAKVGFCGAGFFAYLEGHFHLIGKDGKYHYNTLIPALVFSFTYALSGYVAAYYWNVMWMDCIAIAPLVILGLEKLVKENKAGLYYVTLSLSILMNYYISFILCVFLALYFVVLFLEQKKGRIAAAGRFTLYSLLAGGTGMILIIPEAEILSYSGSSGINFPEEMEWYFNLLAQLSRFCMGAEAYKGNDHWPNLYAGTFTLLLFVLYILNKRISWKQKIPRLLLIALFYVSFAINRLDFIWHGLHFPNSLPGRESFLFIFLLLVMGFEVVRKWKGVRIWQIEVAAVCAAEIIITAYFFRDSGITERYEYILTGAFLAGYVFFMVLDKFLHKKWQLRLRVLLIIFVLSELTANMALTAFSVTSRTSYTAKMKDYEYLLESIEHTRDTEFYRVEDPERKTKNDDALYGYPSATIFSSLMNIHVSHFYQSVGMEGGKNYYCYNGATPLISAMLSVRYLLLDNNMEENALRSIVAESGNYYLYENAYCLPLGFMMDENAIENWDNSGKDDILNINSLVTSLGVDGQLLAASGAESAAEAGETTITMEEDGYYFATRSSCSTNTLDLSASNGRSKTFSKTSHNYILDIGYCKTGDEVTITNSGDETITMTPYILNMEVLEQAYQVLSEQTMTLNKWKDTRIEGEIQVTKAGRFVLSIPDEGGWSLYVDGEKAESTALYDAFISVHLEEGKHDIRLVYHTPKLLQGAFISAGCLGIYILLAFVRRKRKPAGKTSALS